MFPFTDILLFSADAFPKKIVEVMGDPTLSRENVASHLQVRFSSNL